MKKMIFFLAALFVFGSISAQNADKLLNYTSKKASLGFIENKGQIHDQNFKANPEVKYLLCTGNGMNVQLKAYGFSYDTYREEIKDRLANTDSDFKRPDARAEKVTTCFFHRVDVELVGANKNPQIVAEEPSADYLNYYNAVTPESGATRVRHYQKVTYRNIYPGIDMVFTTQASGGKAVEYTFIIHPGADAGQIKLHYTGAAQTQMSGSKINIDVAQGRFTESIPASWIQETNHKLSVAYRNIGDDTYGFDIPYYNSTQTLIIDPNPDLEWGTYYGGSVEEFGTGITSDASGNIYIIGSTSSTSAIATAGAHQTVCAGVDAFIAKFNSGGVRLWGTYYGGSNYDNGYGITWDGTDIYVAGDTYSTESIATVGAHQTVYGGEGLFHGDAFLVKFNTDGVRQWGTYCGGSDDDVAYGVSGDGKENVFIVGTTKSTTGIATAGAHQEVYGGGSCLGDAFIVKFNSAGVRQWGTYYGGNDSDGGTGITCDYTGNVIISGYSDSYNAIASGLAHQTTMGGITDAFIAKFNTSGVRQWATYYGGSGSDYGWAICSDEGENIFITGFTASSTAIATAGAYQTTNGGGSYDVFVVKFDNNGVRQWGSYYGDIETDRGYGIDSDGIGNIYLTGDTRSTSGMTSVGAYQTVYGGSGSNNGDAFVTKFSNVGQFQWGTYYGGSDSDYGQGILCAGNAYVYVTGMTMSVNGITTVGAHQTTYGGGTYDGFIGKFFQAGSAIQEQAFPDDAYFVFPNPVSNELFIEVKGNRNLLNFEILNATGQIVYKGSLTDKTRVQTSGFADGFYLIKLENGKAFTFRKIIKE